MDQVSHDDRPPVVLCAVDQSGETVSFYCAACRDRHEHGHSSAWMEDLGYEIGHRSSHCWSESSPYRFGGYTLVLGTESAKPSRRRQAPQPLKGD